jgi:hypothetical protein
VANSSKTDASNVVVPRGEARVLNHDNFKNPDKVAFVTKFNLLGNRGIVLLKPGRKIGNEDNKEGVNTNTPPAPRSLRFAGP